MINQARKDKDRRLEEDRGVAGRTSRAITPGADFAARAGAREEVSDPARGRAVASPTAAVAWAAADVEGADFLAAVLTKPCRQLFFNELSA